MRTLVSFFLALGVWGVLTAGFSQAMTEEERKQMSDETKDFKFKTVTTPEGFNFNIPEDMPIETRNGITAPIPFEEYLYIKFGKLEEKLNAIDKKIDDLQGIFNRTKKAEPEKVLTPAQQAGVLASS